MKNTSIIKVTGVTRVASIKLNLAIAFTRSVIPSRAAAVALVFLLALVPGNLRAQPPAQFMEVNTYDFSQKPQLFNNTWNNYCAPTAAGDLIYHFGNVVPPLVQGFPYGPGNQPGADTGVTTIIGGVLAANPADPPVGPGPPPGSLAQLMGTTRMGGTTLNGVFNGLIPYLAMHSGNVPWQVQLLLAANVGGGPPFLNMLQQDLANGYDVILAVAWLNGVPPPGGIYTVPNGYSGGTGDGSPIGHAFEMIGYNNNTPTPTIFLNDPANNVGVPGPGHNWIAEAAPYPIIMTPSDFRFVVGGATTAIAYGAVVARPVLPLQLATAVSRKAHTGVGDFDIGLPPVAPFGVECRSGGANGDHTMVITFNNNVVSGNASVTAGTGNVSGVPTFSAKTMTVNLTNVTDVQQIAVTLNGVTDEFAQVLAATVVPMKVLLGDTTGNSAVSSTDVSQTKAAASTGTVDGSTFRTDVNTSGLVNATDVSTVKSKSGNNLP